MDKKIFCHKCNKYVELKIYKKNRKYIVKECEYEILDTITICKECGTEIFNKDEDSIILKELNDRYRREHNLLLSEDIKRIRETYSLTQREFSKLLGFGDVTISRYENGAIQDVANNELIELCKIPGNVSRLSKKSNNKVPESIKQKIDKFISSIPTIFDIANMFILRFWENNKFLTNMKLQKLCYFYWADLITANNKYLDIEFEAWVHGPVNNNLYHKYKIFGDKEIRVTQLEINEIETWKFDDESLDIFEKIMGMYGKYSATELRDISHEEYAWQEANPQGVYSRKIMDYKSVIEQRLYNCTYDFLP